MPSLLLSCLFVQHLATRRRTRRRTGRQEEFFLLLLFAFSFICMTGITSGQGMFALSTAAAASATTGSNSNIRKSLFPNLPVRCPTQCTCDTASGKKRVSCMGGGMTAIPTSQMDRETQVILFSGSPEHPNDAAIGRIFMDLPKLQEIRITYSSLPMIGESTFWPGRELTHLDLSNNRIDRLKDSDFNPLSGLKLLNLSDNQLHDIPSASFRFLTNLTTLSLARNRISKLVPRMFYKLDHLESLDLSDNPLSGAEISSIIFQDIRTLKILRMERSQVKSLSHLTWKELPGLRELHLSDNNLSFLGSYEFTSLSSLKSLHLDGNRVSIIRDNCFFGLRLTHLGLSRNLLTSLPTCAFCNLQVESLDLSSNRFASFQESLLRPLSLSLIALNAGSNSLLAHPSQSISSLLQPLRKAQIIKISWNHLNDSLPDSTFDNLTHLHTLDLSQNQVSNISSAWFANLMSLESLDLSYNLIHGLDPEVLMSFQSISTLKAVHLQNNPWICSRCRILPLMDWIHNHSPPAYFNFCLRSSSPLSSSPPNPHSSMSTTSSSSTASAAGCVMCSQPDHLSGRALHSLTEHDLEFCPDPRIHMRLTASEPRIGLIVAVILIASLCLLVVLIAITYKFKRAAVYYTHEEERFCSEFTHPKISPNHHLSHHHHHHQLRDYQSRHQHNPLRLSRSCCLSSKKRKAFFSFPRSVAASSSASSSPSSTSFPCTPFARSPFTAHSNSFTRKFTNYKSPFKSPFKCSRKSSSSNHSTSPLSQSSSSSNEGSPTDRNRPKVRF